MQTLQITQSQSNEPTSSTPTDHPHQESSGSIDLIWNWA
jgi:hypothetical protein